MPFRVIENADGQLENLHPEEVLGFLEAVSRTCELEDTNQVLLENIKPFKTAAEMIAYASPDSTFAVTKKIFDSAKKSILIGIYDFTAQYMKELLLNALARGIKVSLMLDLDGAKGENDVFKELERFGAETVPAPSCASKRISYFPSSHEKVAIIDDTWVLVQSGNYSRNSIPLNTIDGGTPETFVTGNRDMGVAVKSKSLAKFFTDVLRSDMQLELGAPETVVELPEELPALIEAAPPRQPKRLFPSRTFNPQAAVRILPVLSPDNYMKAVLELLSSAKESVLIEQQYIRSNQSKVAQLLEAIPKEIDVRIILGKIFGDGLAKEKANLQNLKNKYGLKLGTNIRYIDTTRLVHCHNKLIIVDGKRVLISSQNWSDFAVSLNREAGLLIDYPEMAQYFTEIFETDWETARRSLPEPAGGIEAFTINANEIGNGRFIEVNAGDYAEV